MKINNVSMVRSTVRKLSGWSSIYRPVEHRIRPGKCLNRTNIINIIMLTQVKTRTGIIFGVFRRGEYSTEKPSRKGKMVEYSTMHFSL